jgi:hypothetical protein
MLCLNIDTYFEVEFFVFDVYCVDEHEFIVLLAFNLLCLGSWERDQVSFD